MIKISAWFLLPVLLTFFLQGVLLVNIGRYKGEKDLLDVIKYNIFIFAFVDLTIWLVFFGLMCFTSIFGA